MIEHLLPEQIEQRSFEIIDGELKKRGIVLPKEQEMITKRVIHTTADFEYTDTLTFSEGAVGIARELLKKGADIVTDTNMALSGINKRSLAGLGGEVHCYMVLIPEEFPEGYFIPGRMAMTCCAEDMAFLGFACEYDKTNTLTNKQWVKVTAKVTKEYFADYGGEGPVLKAVRVEQTKKPKEEVISFN